MRIIKGEFSGKGLRIAIVYSRFNEAIVKQMLEGAIDVLKRSGVNEEDIDVYEVSGAFELSGFLAFLTKQNGRLSYDAIISLAVIIRGSTPHFDYVASESAKGIARLFMESNLPIVYGIITADTIEQAIERAGVKLGNKGRDAAYVAIELANLYKKVSQL
jgi:6,7-dimethyl-8-ribityllumazine synthase